MAIPRDVAMRFATESNEEMERANNGERERRVAKGETQKPEETHWAIDLIGGHKRKTTVTWMRRKIENTPNWEKRKRVTEKTKWPMRGRQRKSDLKGHEISLKNVRQTLAQVRDDQGNQRAERWTNEETEQFAGECERFAKERDSFDRERRIKEDEKDPGQEIDHPIVL